MHDLILGDKVQIAEQKGAIGVILYSDPYDFAPDLLKNNKTFPEQIWLPPSGAQRGTLLRTNGDPATPFYPSKPYVHRSATEESLRSQGILPSIPVTSIGYRDAVKIFQNLDGAEVAVNRWRGSMETDYRFTGTSLFRLNVNTFISRRPIKNFVAVMHGREEPDRWVLLGNHADAWVKGAIDPGTGTATIGWRPRRTLAFCQWDAEEFGLIGSTEWVEEMKVVLEKRAVAYINVDNINGNTTLQVKAVPLLYRAIVDAAKSQVAHPLPAPEKTIMKGAITGDKSIPAIQSPNSGSDFQRFISFAGVPVADLKLESAPIYSYMLYHSMYEIPWTSDNLVDTSRKTYSALGKCGKLEMARNLAESLIIPFNVEDYGLMLAEYCAKMDAQLLHLKIDLALGEDFYNRKLLFLQEAIEAFQESSNRIQQIVQAFNNNEIALSFRQIDMLNSRLQYLERCFIVDAGIFEERAFFRHSIFTPSDHELYSGISIIIDPAVKWSHAHNSKTKEKQKNADYWLETVRIGFTKLQYTIESAVSLMSLDAFENF
uniref:Glutamate carboxypeptidase n=1 Tax=Ditylenchus dipsaci TaxID=166011 RepID=A0A915CNI9_9BILA